MALKGTEGQFNYFTELLNLALEKTQAEYGALDLAYASMPMVQDRQLQLLDSGGIDLIWSITTRAREQNYLPIYVPLANGLFGYRLFLITSDNQDRFPANISNEQLKQLQAVQATDWPDVHILRANQFKVETETYQNCFWLLIRNYVDYFPRGVSEINGELHLYEDNGVIVEPNLALYYPNLMYFFVKKQNTALAQRLQLGLERAMKDGSFQRLLHQYLVANDVKHILASRRIIVLHNPDMSPKSLRIAKDLPNLQ